MSLFIANISRNVSLNDLEDAFDEFGKCKIRINVSLLYFYVFRNHMLLLTTMMINLLKMPLINLMVRILVDLRLQLNGQKRVVTIMNDKLRAAPFPEKTKKKNDAISAINLVIMLETVVHLELEVETGIEIVVPDHVPDLLGDEIARTANLVHTLVIEKIRSIGHLIGLVETVVIDAIEKVDLVLLLEDVEMSGIVGRKIISVVSRVNYLMKFRSR